MLWSFPKATEMRNQNALLKIKLELNENVMAIKQMINLIQILESQPWPMI